MNDWLVYLLQFILPRRYWYRRFYLRSAHWKELRWKKKTAEDSTCEKCQYTGLDVHHIRYYDGNGSILFREKMSDLELLCRDCHEQKHRNSRKTGV